MPGLLLIGPRRLAGERGKTFSRFVGADLDLEGRRLLALALASYGSCPLGWLGDTPPHQDKTFQISEEAHAIGLVIYCAQMDPGIIWTSISEDASVCQFHTENGVRQVLGRPAILLTNEPGEALRHLLGTLSPTDSDPVSVLGTSRKRGSGIGFLTQPLPTQASFAILQAGGAPMVRRVVAVKDSVSLGSVGAAICGMINACNEIGTGSPKSEIALELAAGIERTVRNYPSRKTVESITNMLAALRSKSTPDEEIRKTFRRMVLQDEGERDAGNVRGISIVLRALLRAIDAILFWSLRWDVGSEANHARCDPMEREARIIRHEIKARRYARKHADRIANQGSIPKDTRILNKILFFDRGPLEAARQGLPGLNYLADLVAVLFGFFMVGVKRMFGALVLEESLSNFATHAFDLALISELHPLFRSPADDLRPCPEWILKGASKDGDDFCILLNPLLEAVRKNERLQKRVQNIQDICTILKEDSDCFLGGLKKASRVRWGDKRDVLLRLSPSAILDTLRPNERTLPQRVDWWLDQLGFKKGGVNSRERAALETLMQENPEYVVLELLNAAALQAAAVPKGQSSSEIVVRVSLEQLKKAREEATQLRLEAYRDKPKSKIHGAPVGEGGLIKPRKTNTTTEGGAIDVNAEMVEIENRIFRRICHLTENNIDRLEADDTVKKMKSYLADELKTMLDEVGKMRFRALALEAIGEMIVQSDQLAALKILDECVPGWR